MLVPKLRFKREDGTDYPEWKKDKWSALGDFVASGTISKADLAETGTPCILYGELYTKYGEIAHTIYSKTSATSHTFSQADDVILPKSGETPEDISTATCVPYDGISLGGDLIVFRHNEMVTGAYLSYLISNRTKNAIASIAQGKSVVHINEKALSNIELPYPQIEEQQKIANFLSNIDEVIAQSRAEIQNLEQQKKAAMQKIFSQEVRFKHEDGTDYPEWEDKTIGAYCDILDNMRKPITKRDRKAGVYPYYGSTNIQDYIDGYIFDEPLVLLGEDAAPFMDSKEKPIAQLATGKYWVNNHAHCLRPHGNVAFFYYSVVHKDIREYINNPNRAKLNQEDMIRIVVSIPCLEEQQKIADFLSTYDEAISYAKQELDKWKELKKGLLQQMFV